MKLIFFGTADFGVPAFEKLEDNYDLALAVTQPDRPGGRGMEKRKSPVKQKAVELDVPIYQPQDVNSADSLARVKKLGVDAFVVAAYGQIMSGQLLDLVDFPLNIHGSLLPKFRGAAPINWAIIEGEEKTGITTMIMDEGLDSGPILLQKETEIGPDETAGKIHDRLADMAGEAILETLSGLKQGELTPKPQQGEPSYAPKLTKEDGRVNWDDHSLHVHNRIRGTYPWPGAYSYYRDQRVQLCGSHNLGPLNEELLDRLLIGDDALTAQPGEVIDNGSIGLVVKCGNNTALRLQNVKPPSKCMMSGVDFINGYQVEIQDAFTSFQ